MSYNKELRGDIVIEPVPSKEAIKHLSLYLDGAVKGDGVYAPKSFCDLEVVFGEGRAFIRSNGCKQGRLHLEWLEFIIQEFADDGCVCNGQMRYRGESFNDVGVITVIDNVVKDCKIW